MTFCELRDCCLLHSSGLPTMPRLAEFIKDRFCRDDVTACPRHMKYRKAGSEGPVYEFTVVVARKRAA